MAGVLDAIAQGGDDCDRLLDFIHKIESGQEETVETGGNDVVLTMDRHGVQVDILVNEDWIGQPEGHFSLREWRIVLEKWREFLALPKSVDTVVYADL